MAAASGSCEYMLEGARPLEGIGDNGLLSRGLDDRPYPELGGGGFRDFSPVARPDMIARESLDMAATGTGLFAMG